MKEINDLNLKDWKNCTARTDSIWVGNFSTLSPRNFGDNKFHSRFHPEIPYQMMLRYTKENETIWDPFAGSGTTIDVGKMLNRKVIANDLYPTRDDIISANSLIWQPEEKVQLLILHPPYWDIVKYGEHRFDLANSKSLNDFLYLFEGVIKNTFSVLERGRFCSLVIGSIYKDSELVPLDYYCYKIIKDQNAKLKWRIVKDFGESKGTNKTNAKTENLWKYRRLKYGFGAIQFEHILVFQKGGELKNGLGKDNTRTLSSKI